MTLIISLITPDKVVQASDRLLTRLDGRGYEDHKNKLVVVACKDATVSISYTGVTPVGKPWSQKRTDIWLQDLASGIPFENRTLSELLRRVGEDASARLNHLPSHIRRLTLAVAGVRVRPDGAAVVPFSLAVSNCEDENEQVLANARELFTVSRETSVSDPALRVACTVHGREDAATAEIRRHIDGLVKSKFFYNADAKTAADELVSLIRRCSDTPVAGKFIGRNCLAVAQVAGHPGCLSWCYRDDGSTDIYAPYIVGATASSRDALLRVHRNHEGTLTDFTFSAWIRFS